MSEHAAILVVYCGNDLVGDDAFGPMVYRAVGTLPGVDQVNLASAPARLLDALAATRELLVIVDVLATEDLPSAGPELIDEEYPAGEALPLWCEMSTSTHGLGLAQQLELARVMNLLPPRVRLIAAAGSRFATGVGASAMIRAMVALAAERIRELPSK